MDLHLQTNKVPCDVVFIQLTTADAAPTWSMPVPLLLKAHSAPTGASVEAWNATSDSEALMTRTQWSLILSRDRTRREVN